jgi:ABC transporter substrate binding protein
MASRPGQGMRRRRFLTLLGFAATWPVAVRAQPGIPMIGLLNGQTPAAFHGPLDAFRKGLGEIGYVENRNVKIEARWADGRPDRLPGLVDDLLRRQAAVIVATAGSFAAARSKAGTTPIVATFGGDPVRQGIVASLNRPGGNVTGVTIITSALEAKRLELMHELLPNSPWWACCSMRIFPTQLASGGRLRKRHARRDSRFGSFQSEARASLSPLSRALSRRKLRG